MPGAVTSPRAYYRSFRSEPEATTKDSPLVATGGMLLLLFVLLLREILRSGFLY
jgi:hypothetical protein